MKKGSVTVFLALILSVLTALVGTELLSVRLAAGRAQIVSALDVGLYSLFAQYDRDLLEEFDLFFLDGTYGGSRMNAGRMYDTFREYTEPVLRQGFSELKFQGGGLTGCELASDRDGEPFYRQAVQAEKSLLAEEGIRRLLEKIRGDGAQAEDQREFQNGKRPEQTLEQYDAKLSEGEAAREEGEEAEAGDGFQPEISLPPENPIDTIRRIMKMGILELVLENPAEVSAGELPGSLLLSGRTKEKGFGMTGGESVFETADAVLFQEYLLGRCGSYRKPGRGKLAYQCEYLLGGRLSDVENLKDTVNRLLLLREGANLLYLYSDGAKRAEVSAFAAALASAFLLPVAAPVLEAALMACWAFAESVLDVRCLLKGGRTAAVKSAADWRLSLERLPYLLEDLDSASESQQKGMDYTDYLRVLLLSKSKRDKVLRGMDMVECSMRGIEGRENFRLDCCVFSLEAAADVSVCGKKTYTSVRSYSYDCRE